MTPRLATVLSARPWESGLVAVSRETAAVRLVLRAYQPRDLDERRDEIDIVVAGSETSWVTPARVSGWRRSGLGVVGIFPTGDQPAHALLETGGAHEILADDTPPQVILQAVRLMQPAQGAPLPEATGELIVVTGPRGAPGRTEVALALARQWAERRRTVLLDLDRDAPGVAIRLGLPPRPDLADVAERVRQSGEIPGDVVRKLGPLSVIVGSHRPDEPPLRSTLCEDVAEAAAAAFDAVVVDLGPDPFDTSLLKQADHAVLVAEACATGIVRAARMTAEWSGPPPALILNRALGDTEDMIRAARRWTGLEPTAVIKEHPRIRRAARSAVGPDRRMRRGVRGLELPGE